MKTTRNYIIVVAVSYLFIITAIIVSSRAVKVTDNHTASVETIKE